MHCTGREEECTGKKWGGESDGGRAEQGLADVPMQGELEAGEGGGGGGGGGNKAWSAQAGAAFWRKCPSGFVPARHKRLGGKHWWPVLCYAAYLARREAPREAPPHFATKLLPQPHEEAALGLAAMTKALRIRSLSKSTAQEGGGGGGESRTGCR